MKDAWYSPTADYRCGHAIYLDERGRRVKVSCVVEIGQPHGMLWPDMQYVGQVTEFVDNVNRLPEPPEPDDPEFWKKAAEWNRKTLNRLRSYQAETN